MIPQSSIFFARGMPRGLYLRSLAHEYIYEMSRDLHEIFGFLSDRIFSETAAKNAYLLLSAYRRVCLSITLNSSGFARLLHEACA